MPLVIRLAQHIVGKSMIIRVELLECNIYSFATIEQTRTVGGCPDVESTIRCLTKRNNTNTLQQKHIEHKEHKEHKEHIEHIEHTQTQTTHK